MNLPVLVVAQPGCEQCLLHCYPGPGGHVGIPSRWLSGSLPPSPETPALFCIGMNPDWKENERGMAFVGRSGELLTTAYLGGGNFAARCTVYLGHCARCYAPAETPPKAKHYAACSPFLWQDIRSVIPTCSHLHLLALGADAANVVLKEVLGVKKKMTLSSALTHQGKTLPYDGHPLTCWVTNAPNACFRNPNTVFAVNGHLQLLSDRLEGLSPPKTKPKIVGPRSPHP